MRKLFLIIFAVLLVACSGGGTSRPRTLFRGATKQSLWYACANANGVGESTRQGVKPQPCANPTDKIYSWPVIPQTSTTTLPVTSTTSTTFGLRRCFGVQMTQGQTDIDNNPTGTTFCLSGTHNWTLTPKADDQIISDKFNPGILDGGNTTQYAIIAVANNVVIDGVEVRNYHLGDQQPAIQGGANWILRNVISHDNGTAGATQTAGGYGAGVATGEQIIGGRYYNNRQGGLQGGGATNAIVDGAEIDHNNFTDDTYTNQNIDCNYEAGGMKWVANGLTVKNSRIHDNACRGLWADIGANNYILTNNQIYNNWDEGIFIEISGPGTITNNTVTGNGYHTQLLPLATNPLLNGCTTYLGEGAGIWIGTSGKTHTSEGNIEISGNSVIGNCNSIMGFETSRTDTSLGVCGPGGLPCQLYHLRVHDNTVTAGSDSRALNELGWYSGDGADLTTHDIIYGSGNVLTGITNCQFSCPG